MTATQIIRAIETLPPEEQAKVVRFAYRLDAGRKLSGGELSALAQRMVDSHDPAESALLRASITQGFYGVTPNA
jgi:hypothetical protein